MKILKQLILCVGVWGSAISAFSQDATSLTQSEKKQNKPRLKVSCLGVWEGVDLYIKSSKKKEATSMKRIEILDMGYSPAMIYKPGRPVQFFKKSDSQEQPYTSLFRVTIPENYQYPLILLIPKGKKISYRVFNLDPKVFPYGSCKMVNVSGQELVIAMDKDARFLKPKQSKLFMPAKEQKARSWLRIAKPKSKKLLFSCMMIRRQHKRMIVFLGKAKDDQGVSILKTRMLVDFKPTLNKDGKKMNVVSGH